MPVAFGLDEDLQLLGEVSVVLEALVVPWLRSGHWLLPSPVSSSGSKLCVRNLEAEAVARADALCTALHGVLRSAGFDLTDVADEQHAKVGPP